MNGYKKQKRLLKPVKKSRQYENIVEQIRSLILKGEYRPGERLPSERELCKELEVGRPSIRDALRVLEILGLIEIRHGEGTFVRSMQVPDILESITQILRTMFEANYDSLFDLLEVREALEVQIAILASENATDSDIEKIGNCLEGMKKNLLVPEKLMKADDDFHRLLAEATKNDVIGLILENIRSLMFQNYKVIYSFVCQSENLSRKTFQAHKRIYEAIKENGSNKASQAMAEHMRQNKQNLIDAIRKSSSKTG